MRLATCCMACSGSVSMELLYHAKPTVIHYRISPLAFAVQKRFRKVKYITLVNLLSTGELYPADLSPYDPAQADADKVLFPEYLTCEDKSAAVAGHVIQWLTDPAALARQIAALEALKAEVAHGGASARAAEYILRELNVGRPSQAVFRAKASQALRKRGWRATRRPACLRVGLRCHRRPRTSPTPVAAEYRFGT